MGLPWSQVLHGGLWSIPLTFRDLVESVEAQVGGPLPYPSAMSGDER